MTPLVPARTSYWLVADFRWELDVEALARHADSLPPEARGDFVARARETVAHIDDALIERLARSSGRSYAEVAEALSIADAGTDSLSAWIRRLFSAALARLVAHLPPSVDTVHESDPTVDFLVGFEHPDMAESAEQGLADLHAALATVVHPDRIWFGRAGMALSRHGALVMPRYEAVWRPMDDDDRLSLAGVCPGRTTYEREACLDALIARSRVPTDSISSPDSLCA